MLYAFWSVLSCESMPTKILSQNYLPFKQNKNFILYWHSVVLVFCPATLWCYEGAPFLIIFCLFFGKHGIFLFFKTIKLELKKKKKCP